MTRELTLACLLGFSIPQAIGDDRNRVKFGTQHWPPYQYYQDGRLKGVAIDALNCIMKRLNAPFDIVVRPWLRVQREVANGSLDAFFAASKSDKRDEFAIQSAPFIKQTWEFYLLKDYQHPLQIEYIKSHANIAARQNSNVLEWLNIHHYKVLVTPLNVDSLIRTLKSRRVDAIMENSEVFYHHLKLSGEDPDQFVSIKNIDHHLGVYFGKDFVRSNVEFLSEFNANTSYCSNIEKSKNGKNHTQR